MGKSDKKQEFKLLTAGSEFNYVKAGELLYELKEALKKKKPVELDLRDTGSIDVTSLQFLVAARRSFEDAGIPLKVRFECTEEAFSLISKCGLAEKTGAKSM